LSDHSTYKPTFILKPYSRFREHREQQQKERYKEDWSTAFLIDEIYIKLMSIKYRDSEGILRRKYEELVRKEMGWMAVPPHTTVINVSLADFDDKIREELSKDDQVSREFTLKEAVGKICEVVDSRTYLLNAMPFLKVELEE
jgi:hypothetical protein